MALQHFIFARATTRRWFFAGLHDFEMKTAGQLVAASRPSPMSGEHIAVIHPRDPDIDSGYTQCTNRARLPKGGLTKPYRPVKGAGRHIQRIVRSAALQRTVILSVNLNAYRLSDTVDQIDSPVC